MITADNVKAGILLGAVGLAAFAVYRTGKVAGDVVQWVTDIPERVTEYAREGGAAFQGVYTPNEVNRTNSTAPEAAYTPVYNDPLVSDMGMDWRYF